MENRDHKTPNFHLYLYEDNMNNPKPMRHIPSVRLLRTSRVVAWTVATFDLFLLSAGFRVGPCWHVVGRRQLGCIDSPLVRGCSGGSSLSAATMCAEEGNLRNRTIVGIILDILSEKKKSALVSLSHRNACLRVLHNSLPWFLILGCRPALDYAMKSPVLFA